MSFLPPLPRKLDPWTWLRNSFLAGVALVLPFVVTGWLIWVVVSFIDANVLPIVPGGLRPIAQAIPGMGVLIALAALTLVGAAAGNLFGRWVVTGADYFIGNLPIVRSIYGGAKQVFQQVAAPERTSFKHAVMVEFPSPGAWTIGFVTNEDTAETAADTGEALIAVFVPFVPLPTAGFLIYLPRRSIRPMQIGPDEALKRVLSLGIIQETAEPSDRQIAK